MIPPLEIQSEPLQICAIFCPVVTSAVQVTILEQSIRCVIDNEKSKSETTPPRSSKKDDKNQVRFILFSEPRNVFFLFSWKKKAINQPDEMICMGNKDICIMCLFYSRKIIASYDNGKQRSGNNHSSCGMPSLLGLRPSFAQ